MSADWPAVLLNEILQPIERREDVVPGKVYRQIGVKLWGMGAYERESLDGSQTRYKTLSCVEADDVIVNKIWARNGSVAVVTEDLAGCYGSNEFPTFAPFREKILPRWFHWFTKTPGFWSQCDDKSRGTSGKNRIRPERFLEIEIPLPPLDEQRRLVARIEELAAKIEEAQKLRRQAAEEGEVVLSSAKNALFNKEHMKKWRNITLGEIADIQSGVTLGRKLRGPTIKLPYLRVANVQDGYLDLKTIKTIEILEDERDKWQLQSGDILLTEGGDWDKLGRGTVWHCEI